MTSLTPGELSVSIKKQDIQEDSEDTETLLNMVLSSPVKWRLSEKEYRIDVTVCETLQGFRCSCAVTCDGSRHRHIPGNLFNTGVEVKLV